MKKKLTAMQLGEGLEQGQSDLERLKNMSDDDIDCSDIPALDDDFFKNAKIVTPPAKEQLTIRLDNDMLEWFKNQGKGYQTRINSVLRAYYNAHQSENQSSPKP